MLPVDFGNYLQDLRSVYDLYKVGDDVMGSMDPPKASNARPAPVPTPVEAAFFNRAGPWDDKNLDTVITANFAWRKRMVLDQPTFFDEIKRGHAPKILWIGCSDARVPANVIIGQPPGAVFVHRNVANMVVNTDFNCMSVIQYAVDYLQVKHIIVCGHYDCGGVKAALTQVDHKAPLENWLRNIRDTYRLHRKELNAIEDITARQRRLVELNVVEQVNYSSWKDLKTLLKFLILYYHAPQCLNIFKTAVVQRKRVSTHQLIGKEG